MSIAPQSSYNVWCWLMISSQCRLAALATLRMNYDKIPRSAGFLMMFSSPHNMQVIFKLLRKISYGARDLNPRSPDKGQRWTSQARGFQCLFPNGSNIGFPLIRCPFFIYLFIMWLPRKDYVIRAYLVCVFVCTYISLLNCIYPKRRYNYIRLKYPSLL